MMIFGIKNLNLKTRIIQKNKWKLELQRFELRSPVTPAGALPINKKNIEFSKVYQKKKKKKKKIKI